MFVWFPPYWLNIEDQSYRWPKSTFFLKTIMGSFSILLWIVNRKKVTNWISWEKYCSCKKHVFKHFAKNGLFWCDVLYVNMFCKMYRIRHHCLHVWEISNYQVYGQKNNKKIDLHFRDKIIICSLVQNCICNLYSTLMWLFLVIV